MRREHDVGPAPGRRASQGRRASGSAAGALREFPLHRLVDEDGEPVGDAGERLLPDARGAASSTAGWC